MGFHFKVMIKHLKDQARHAELERDQLSACKVRCTALETEISKLKDELAEARRCHAPVSLTDPLTSSLPCIRLGLMKLCPTGDETLRSTQEQNSRHGIEALAA